MRSSKAPSTSRAATAGCASALPPNEHGARHTVVPEFREKLYVLRGRVGAPPERRVGRGLAAYRHPHTRHHLTSFDPVDLAEAFFRRLPVGTRKLRALPRTSSDAPATLARCAEKTGVPDEAWAVANANASAHTNKVTRGGTSGRGP